MVLIMLMLCLLVLSFVVLTHAYIQCFYKDNGATYFKLVSDSLYIKEKIGYQVLTDVDAVYLLLSGFM